MLTRIKQCAMCKSRTAPLLVFILLCITSIYWYMCSSETSAYSIKGLIFTNAGQQSSILTLPLHVKDPLSNPTLPSINKAIISKIPTNKQISSYTSTIVKSSVSLMNTATRTSQKVNNTRAMAKAAPLKSTKESTARQPSHTTAATGVASLSLSSSTNSIVEPQPATTATIVKPGTSKHNPGKPIASTPTKDGCPFQNVDPFDPTTMTQASTLKQIDCSEGLPTVVYIGNDGTLQVNFTQVKETTGKLDYCRYTRLELSDENDSELSSFKWSQKFLSEPIQLMDEDEQVWVQCFLNKAVVSQNFMGRILRKPQVERECDADYKIHVKENDPLETLSILIVGMDGMSKQNLARTMPKTRDYIINKLNAKELKKFNKVGDNTFPNVIALHTGYSQPELYRVWDHEEQYLDDIEEKFIWHEYQKSGYRTGMGFDVTWTTAYHYLKRGWKHPTFDYYIRPLTLIMNEDKTCRKGGRDCVGDIPELVVLQDYVIQMVSLFNNTKTKPYFIYNFYTKLTHDDQNGASKGDDIYFRFFQQLNREKVLNNTVVIFFSDHGARFGELRKTFHGKIEINTPFVFFIFPPWFERKYPDLMETLRINQNRLTTFFDIHQTLKELLKFKGTTKKGDLNSRAISLFDEIPMERNCSHADIPMEFCNCKLLSKMNVNEEVRSRISSGLLDAIVNRTKDHRDICALLSLESIKSILTMQTDDKAVPYYKVTMTTKPGGGMYEALMKFDTKTKTASLIGDIVRLNHYKGQDACVNMLQLKLYCFCTS